MRALLRRVFGESKRELREKIDFFRKDRDRLYTKAEHGDALLSAEIDRLNSECDQINHRLAALTFENERLTNENQSLGLEGNDLRLQLRRFYKADGTYDVMPWNVNVPGLYILLGRERDATYAENKELHEGVERLKAEIRSWIRQHNGSEEKIKSLTADNERLQGEIDQAVLTSSASLDQRDEAYAERDKMRAEIEKEREIHRHYVENYVKLLADEKERLRLRVVALREELDAVVATASETNREHDAAIASWSIDHEELLASRRLIKEQADKIAEFKVAICKAEAEEAGLDGYIDAVDTQISEALEAVGKFPPKPAGAPDRVDVICDLVRDQAHTINTLQQRLSEGEATLNEGIEHIDRLVEGSRILEAEVERLTKLLMEPKLLDSHIRQQGDRMRADVTLKHWASRLMVQSFADSLSDAPHAIELSISDPEHGHFLVTVQRRQGKSPTDLLNEAKEKIGRLEIALEASAELEQKWKRQRRALKAKIERLLAADRQWHMHDQAERAIAHKKSVEMEHVNNTCQELRTENDELRREIINDNLGHRRRADRAVRNTVELVAVADDLYVALADLVVANTHLGDAIKARPLSMESLELATSDALASWSQAEHYLKMYAPIPKEEPCTA